MQKTQLKFWYLLFLISKYHDTSAGQNVNQELYNTQLQLFIQKESLSIPIKIIMYALNTVYIIRIVENYEDLKQLKADHPEPTGKIKFYLYYLYILFVIHVISIIANIFTCANNMKNKIYNIINKRYIILYVIVTCIRTIITNFVITYLHATILFFLMNEKDLSADILKEFFHQMKDKKDLRNRLIINMIFTVVEILLPIIQLQIYKKQFIKLTFFSENKPKENLIYYS